MGDVSEMLAEPPAGFISNVFEAPAPPEAKYPMAIFQQIPGTPDTNFGDGTVAMVEHQYLIKVVSEGNAYNFGAMDYLHNSIINQVGDVDGWKINCIRLESFSMPVNEDTKIYRQIGGRYKLILRPQVY
jgi:hypothetical protein